MWQKTGAIQPGSRVMWRYKLAERRNSFLAGYESWPLPQLKPEHRWYGLARMTGRGNRSNAAAVLLLSALLTLLLAVAAVAVAMSHYRRSRYDSRRENVGRGPGPVA